jgi:hypothetical protein
MWIEKMAGLTVSAATHHDGGIGHCGEGKMPYRADLQLANLHRQQVDAQIEEQRARVASLQKAGQESKSAEDLLNVLLETRSLLIAYIQRTAPVTGHLV